jgi:hypothetical protein
MLKADILDVDERIGARIDQLDQVTERRLGNLDTIAAKTTNALSSALLRLIAFGCLVIFAAAAVWRVYVESTGAWPSSGSLFSRIAQWWKKVRTRLSWQLGLAAGAIALLFITFAVVLPSGSSGKLERTHLAHLQRALTSFDFTQAKYHASQLKVLNPSDDIYGGYALKIELLRDVLTRPALYETTAGLHQIIFRIEQTEMQVAPQRDPDLETLKALLVFRTNPNRQTEHDAAMLCAGALDIPAKRSALASLFGRSKPKLTPADGGFALQPLAVSYIENYLSHPLARPSVAMAAEKDAPREYSTQELASLVTASKKRNPRSPRTLTALSHVVTYNTLVSRLYATVLPAYQQMIEAQAMLSTAEPERRQEFLNARARAAKTIIKAWGDLDDKLDEHHSMTDTSTTFAVFRLNDAMYTRARAYLDSQSTEIPGALNVVNYPNDGQRARMLPPRTVWADRYLSNLDTTMHHVISFQEAERFRTNEQAAIQFENNYVKYLQIKNAFHHTGDQALVRAGEAAALSAARINLSFGAHDVSTEIVAAMRSLLTDQSAKELGFAKLQENVDKTTREAAVSYL